MSESAMIGRLVSVWRLYRTAPSVWHWRCRRCGAMAQTRSEHPPAECPCAEEGWLA